MLFTVLICFFQEESMKTDKTLVLYWDFSSGTMFVSWNWLWWLPIVVHRCHRRNRYRLWSFLLYLLSLIDQCYLILWFFFLLFGTDLPWTPIWGSKISPGLLDLNERCLYILGYSSHNVDSVSLDQQLGRLQENDTSRILISISDHFFQNQVKTVEWSGIPLS